ncbi:unnamed protein product [Caenorhabditis auriculariae]|uniref:Transcription and mRNA export factor ENY2 n=1 Tax=Caenorhabditis auriculariae TaxID=2777116 RepID=A0A8S1HGD2_9PELO|nr:unnamed protein product [Caenorhabditis auriculariae]
MADLKDEDSQALSVPAHVIEEAFSSSGEENRCKENITRRLVQEGWEEKTRENIIQTVKELGDNATMKEVFEAVKDDCRRRVPSSVKKELFDQVHAFVIKTNKQHE